MSPEQKLAAIEALCLESEEVWCHNATSSDFKIPPFDRHGVRQLREVLDTPLPDATWALGWYGKTRHVVGSDTPYSDGSTAAICSRYTTVCIKGYGKQDVRYNVPAANTPETMAKPACKHCEKILARRA